MTANAVNIAVSILVGAAFACACALLVSTTGVGDAISASIGATAGIFAVMAIAAWVAKSQEQKDSERLRKMRETLERLPPIPEPPRPIDRIIADRGSTTPRPKP